MPPTPTKTRERGYDDDEEDLSEQAWGPFVRPSLKASSWLQKAPTRSTELWKGRRPASHHRIPIPSPSLVPAEVYLRQSTPLGSLITFPFASSPLQQLLGSSSSSPRELKSTKYKKLRTTGRNEGAGGGGLAFRPSLGILQTAPRKLHRNHPSAKRAREAWPTFGSTTYRVIRV